MNQYWFMQVKDDNLDAGEASLPARMIVNAGTREMAQSIFRKRAESFSDGQRFYGRLYGPFRTELEAESCEIFAPLMSQD